MRKFYLTNASGEEYDLQDVNNVVFFDPEGLGYEESNTFQQIGNSFVSLDAKHSQRTIDGTMVCLGDDPYKTYFKLVQFLNKAPLTMKYVPTDGMEYFIKLRATSLSKAEVTYVDAMAVSVTFAALSPFYKTLYAFNKGEVEGGTKTYKYVSGDEEEDLLYGYSYNYEYSDAVAQTVVLNSDTPLDSPVKLTIYGPATNPKWQHYIEGVLVEQGEMTGEIAEGNRLVIDNTTIPYSINEYNGYGGLVADRYQLCDFSKDRFMYAKLGINRFSISHDGPEVLAMSVETNLEYAAI